jgi:N,N'-diacetylbacillosaminyl-diphospho-undecaprenol alpha-1,3-N-acetylgalactosaminyltransferase
MKIAFVTPDGLSTLIWCRWFVENLSSRPDFECYTVSSKDLYAKEIESLPSTHINIECERFVNPRNDLRYFFELLRQFRRERFDVVVTLGPKPNVYGGIAAWMAGVGNVVVSVRGLGRMFGPSRSLKVRLIRGLLAGLYRLSCYAAARVWFTNPGDRAYFVEHGMVSHDKTFLTPNSINIDFFAEERVNQDVVRRTKADLGIAQRDLAVIMVARLVWAKGIREYAEAAATLSSKYPHVHFLLVAPVEDAGIDAVPESYVRAMEAKANLQWLGYRKDVRELYALADIAVLPSYYKEGGYPRALLEPMALRKPVIGADTDDCRGPVENGVSGFLVPPRDTSALAQKIEELISNPDLRRRFGDRSIQIVQTKFSDEVVGRQVLRELGVS